jgi:hypothetical protein
LRGFVRHDKCSLPCVTVKKYILMDIPMFSGSRNLMMLSAMLLRLDVGTGIEKFKIAAF